MSEAVVKVEFRGPVAWVTINRPSKLNALSSEVVKTMTNTIRELEANDDVRVIVITGEGKNFSVGYDIAEEVEAGIARPEDWHGALTRNVGLSMAVWSVTKPTIAAVDGWCLAGACELAMACDMIIATDRANFGEPEIRFGSGPVTLLMPFLIGQKKTNELLLTGDVVAAAEAERLGLINRVTRPEDLQATVSRLAERISVTPPITLKLTKISLTRAYEAMGLRNAVNVNLDLAATLNAAYSPEKAEFGERVKNDGLRSALNWRDSRYGKLEADSKD
ncbi:enoyl-CoA hydratase/isomerase family protein [Burkholderia cenocepacia]|uniref:Enoyl-CoA hydratase/isomerase family protein n=1 Tax=Burkholderia cenocepacia TaxID=95486 RepID=A0ABD4UL23_9BURK|nr:enoyl-CoA hydratase/isomerase family protein [Burkholderia cenocepacia]MCW3698914.1 enoyl-CoA hydratase/isomerase family protein [Burkholderia cenocepacia]MCW3706532.1 enoyl-CoA hydratase/isomerase family protein [Burkholderia cenocepacia]MCW3714977.1 enoyl-CoA hydratase/isomerase family protein [Burkholderia cenocepacia]MCW3722707.1 enoyl-CoA hydratase/isomerase family protein [Burkholderia cenocepacia]MCW3729761.1 enoyl-CoA hydratase/isomerase family protein [Burkholderia cenocepacia]